MICVGIDKGRGRKVGRKEGRERKKDACMLYSLLNNKHKGTEKEKEEGERYKA